MSLYCRLCTVSCLLSIDFTGRERERERGNKGEEREFCPFELLRWIPSPLSLPCYLIHCHAAVRHAVGVEVILGALSFATRKSPKELHVLDAGIYFVFRVL